MKAILITVLVLYSIVSVIGFIQLVVWDFPHEREPMTLGTHLASLVLSLALVFWIAIVLSGCAIPVVGNSPEEIKHRKYLETAPPPSTWGTMTNNASPN